MNSEHSGILRMGIVRWTVTAVVVLAAAAWILNREAVPAHADNGGAASAGVMAMMGTLPNNEHLYLIDTNHQIVLMYEWKSGNDFRLVAGRSFDADALFLSKLTGKYLKYSEKGYEKEIAEALAASSRSKD